MTDFAAIDFETANGQRSSVCSVGVVVVRGGLITDTFMKTPTPLRSSQRCGDKLRPASPDCPWWPTTVLSTRAASRPCSKPIRWIILITSSFAPAGPRAAISDSNCPTTSCIPCRPPVVTPSRTITTPSPMPRPARGLPWRFCRDVPWRVSTIILKKFK